MSRFGRTTGRRTGAAVNPHSHDDADGPEDDDANRRGFQRGSEAALRAVEDGVSERSLIRWRAAIYRWRFAVSHRRQIAPPTVGTAP